MASATSSGVAVRRFVASRVRLREARMRRSIKRQQTEEFQLCPCCLIMTRHQKRTQKLVSFPLFNVLSMYKPGAWLVRWPTPRGQGGPEVLCRYRGFTQPRTQIHIKFFMFFHMVIQCQSGPRVNRAGTGKACGYCLPLVYVRGQLGAALRGSKSDSA